MTATYWIKLYTEILYDPKMCRLDDHLYRRTIELFLMAGEEKKDGALPSIDNMAWTLRTSAEQLETELIELQRIGILIFDNGWIVRKFSERQAPADKTAAERMRRWRERNVTPALRVDTESESESDTDTESEREGEDRFQHLLETIVGLPACPADLPGIDELEKIGANESDIRGNLQWRKDNNVSPAKRLSQLFDGIKVEHSKRVQNGNARKNGKPARVEEAVRWSTDE
jgi:hypothetical protein